MSDGSLIKTLDGHTRPVGEAVFSADGKLLDSKARDGMGLLKDSDGSQIHMFEYPGLDEAFSPEGSTLAVANYNGSIALYSTAGSLLAEYDGHASTVSGIVFSPNGGLLFTALIDGTVRVWIIKP
ncbi:MAG: hypothetical protein KAS36_12720 [Anaerolineales bacterium]|nr:hypothetical protein [Anaerolineales bacterium]